jgi:hypothetical protein
VFTLCDQGAGAELLGADGRHRPVEQSQHVDGAEPIAWITVQKVSNLILDMNVYIADVATGKMTFVHSVDIRGNTDQAWTRSLPYLLESYLLPDAS